MPLTLIPMKGEEFVRKVLDGQKDFRAIKLEEGFDLGKYEGYEDFLRYLQTRPHYRDPISIRGSEFLGLRAPGLHLPYVNAKEADFRGSCLLDAFFYQGIFDGADFSSYRGEPATLSAINFNFASLKDVDFSNSDIGLAKLCVISMEGANLYLADVFRADFTEANMEGVLNLQHALNLKDATFLNTRVTPTEKSVIEDALKKRVSLVVR